MKGFIKMNNLGQEYSTVLAWQAQVDEFNTWYQKNLKSIILLLKTNVFLNYLAFWLQGDNYIHFVQSFWEHKHMGNGVVKNK